jgi:hypothetical protein
MVQSRFPASALEATPLSDTNAMTASEVAMMDWGFRSE